MSVAPVIQAVLHSVAQGTGGPVQPLLVEQPLVETVREGFRTGLPHLLVPFRAQDAQFPGVMFDSVHRPYQADGLFDLGDLLGVRHKEAAPAVCQASASVLDIRFGNLEYPLQAPTNSFPWVPPRTWSGVSPLRLVRSTY